MATILLITNCWAMLFLLRAPSETLFEQTAQSMLTWITEVKSQIVTTTEEVIEEIGLVEINEQIKDQDRKDQEMIVKKRMLEDIAVSSLVVSNTS